MKRVDAFEVSFLIPHLHGISFEYHRPYNEEHRYIGGVSWGRHPDHTVYVVLDATQNSMAELLYFRAADWKEQKLRLDTIHAQWKVDAWSCDQNAMGQSNVEAMWAAGFPMRPLTVSRHIHNMMIERLIIDLQRGELAILPDARLRSELLALCAIQLRTGAITYGPSARHESGTIDATALAWWICHQELPVQYIG